VTCWCVRVCYGKGRHNLLLSCRDRQAAALGSGRRCCDIGGSTDGWRVCTVGLRGLSAEVANDGLIYNTFDCCLCSTVGRSRWGRRWV
jgi:hypothetical protein